MRRAFVLCLVAGCLPVSADPPPPTLVRLYDPNPEHLWNRLHAALLTRSDRGGTVVGHDALDALLWPTTKSLLEGPSHAAAVKVLDEFLAGGHALVRDPVKRAVMQRDLWGVFDWAAYPFGNFYTRGDPIQLRDGPLQQRLAKAIRTLAPPKADAAALPDTFALAVRAKAFPAAFDPAKPNDPFLPPDLFDDRGPWVCVTGPREMTTPVASEHARIFAGRSAFLVFIKLPEGRAATLAYLDKLNAAPDPWKVKPRHPDETGQSPISGELKSGLPQFPVGTQVALVRQLAVVTDDGRTTPTAVTESVQLRTFRAIRARSRDFPEQGLVELKLRRSELFAGRAGGLRATKADEPVMPALSFFRSWTDPLEEKSEDGHHRPEPAFTFCAACHAHDGVYSVQSYSQMGHPNRPLAPALVPTTAAAERKRAAEWKAGLKDWAALKKHAGW